MTNLKHAWGTALMLTLAFTFVMIPDMAAAGGTIGRVLCNVVDWFNGPIGRGIATLAIIVIGVGALMGKVSWGMAIIVGVGVAVVFGADTIVGELGADGAGDGCDAGTSFGGGEA